MTLIQILSTVYTLLYAILLLATKTTQTLIIAEFVFFFSLLKTTNKYQNGMKTVELVKSRIKRTK